MNLGLGINLSKIKKLKGGVTPPPQKEYFKLDKGKLDIDKLK